MSNLSVFNFNETNSIRAIDNEWFVASDVCAGLGIVNSRDAVATLQNNLIEAGIKGVVSTDTLINTNGGKQKVLCVNEAGLNLLIMQSRKKSAVKFKYWVAAEVLPSIRKTGSYTLTINPEQQQAIKSAVQAKAHRDYHGSYQATYRDFYKAFNIPRYQELPASKFNDAIEWLNDGFVSVPQNYISDDILLLIKKSVQSTLANVVMNDDIYRAVRLINEQSAKSMRAYAETAVKDAVAIIKALDLRTSNNIPMVHNSTVTCLNNGQFSLPVAWCISL